MQIVLMITEAWVAAPSNGKTDFKLGTENVKKFMTVLWRKKKEREWKKHKTCAASILKNKQ